MDAYLGEIRIFAGNYAPEGWLKCDGSTVQISANPALFSLLGTMYGGDGKATFGLPNLGGRIPVGAGKLTGGSTYTVAQTGGADLVALTDANMPAHTHAMYASSAAAATNVPGPTVVLATVQAPNRMYMDTTVATGTWGNLSGNAIAKCTGGAPHDNTMPTVVLTYIICAEGLYPGA